MRAALAQDLLAERDEHRILRVRDVEDDQVVERDRAGNSDDGSHTEAA